MPAKRLLICILLLLCTNNICAQPPAGKFKLFFEKVYLHTDRELYAGGEDIWFKAYLVNAQNNKPIGTSNNLYVELLSPSGDIVLRNIIRLDQGIGNGDFKLSDTIPPGQYRIRAYTNWMRNFGDNFVFEKNLNIISTTHAKQIAKPVIPGSEDISIHFYPEGGSLITGITSFVAVKAQNTSGKGIAVKGAVLNSGGDTVTGFKTDTLGMGLFTLLPISGQTYAAVNLQNGNRFNLPRALTNGYNLAVNQSDTLVNIIINTSDTVLSAGTNKVVILQGKHGGILYLRKSIVIKNAQTPVRVPKSFFPEGLTDFTVADADNKPQSERLVYIHHRERKNELYLIADKARYSPREKVTLHLTLADTTQRANLSMTVIDEGLALVPVQNIQNYLELSSELEGTVEHPERYFDTTNVNRYKQLDMLLMVQGWRDFIWRRIADTAIQISNATENGFTISGRVRQKLADRPRPGINITLTAFKAKGQKLYSAQTDSAGRYSIPDVQMYGPQPISITARNDKGERSGWLMLDSITREPLAANARPNYLIDTTTRLFKAILQRVTELKKEDAKRMLKEVKITANKTVILSNMAAASVGYIDQVFTITKKDEYYQALDNWLAHNIKGAIINDNPGVYFTGLGGDPDHLKGLLAPRLIVNGREVVPPAGKYFEPPQRVGMVYHSLSDEDYEMQSTIRQQYYNLTMDKIKHIELKHLLGPDPDYGKTIDVYVLYLTVTANAFENKDFGVENADVTGYYKARTFYKPVYDISADKAKLDMRTTIHWEPNVITTTNGQAIVTFYNADPKTKVRVMVEGITDRGVPLAAGMDYEVK